MNAGRDIPNTDQITATPTNVNKFMLVADNSSEWIAERSERRRAAEHARQQAFLDLDHLACLPDLHAAALLRSVGLPERSTAVLRERLTAEPLTITLYEASPGAGQRTIEQAIAATVERLESITPPDRECGPLGRKLVRGDEEQIRAEAERLAAEWTDIYKRGTELHADDPATQAERMCARWWRRQLRRSALRAQAYYDCALRIARPGERYVSGYTLAAWRDRQARSKAWAAGIDVQWDDGSNAPLTDIIENAQKAKRAQMHAIVNALEFTAAERDYGGYFLTLTLPSEYHSVSAGEADANGKYHPREVESWTPEHGPQEQIAELNRRWALIRARLAKHRALRDYYGILVPEPHQDGTPHMHAMLWLPNDNGRGRTTEAIIKEILEDIAPGRQSKLDIIERSADGKSSPARYVMKYVIKSLNDSAGEDAPDGEASDGEEHLIGEANDRYRAWASARGIRRMRLVGVHGSLRIWQRLWTAGADEQLPPRADAARAALRTGQAAAKLAVADDTTEADRARHRQKAAAAFAEALHEIADLRLTYDESTTQYGRPSKKPVGIEDRESGESFPLRLRQAVFVPRDEQQKPAENLGTVTVATKAPRERAAHAPANTDPEVPRLKGWQLPRRTRPIELPTSTSLPPEQKRQHLERQIAWHTESLRLCTKYPTTIAAIESWLAADKAALAALIATEIPVAEAA